MSNHFQNFQYSVPLAPLCTFHIGGNADMLVEIHTKEDLQNAILWAQKNKVPFFPLGGGSNLVFADEGFRGMILHFQNKNILFQNENSTFIVEAGTKNSLLYQFAKKQNFDFSVWNSIPGTLGGAVCGNAGIPGSEMEKLVVCATVFHIPEQQFCTVDHNFFKFSYRKSVFHDPEFQKKYILWDTTLHLPHLPEEEITNNAKNLLAKRKEKQPWGFTGGSFFKNPTEGPAGYFLDQVGAKQMRVGDAFFSEKHANFLMNAGNATQKEVVELAKKGMQAVYEKFGIVLHPEVRIIDEFGNLKDF